MHHAMKMLFWPGAVLTLVGILLVGSAVLWQGSIEQTDFNCLYSSSHNCGSQVQNSANLTVDSMYLQGTGWLLTGIGAFLFMLSVPNRPSGPEMAPANWSSSSPTWSPPANPPMPPH